MSERVMKVRFASVSAIRYPQYYRGDRPCVTAASVPDEHWHYVEREGDADGVMRQYEGLMELMYRGELIRDVSVHEAERVEPQWREITPAAPPKAATGGASDG